MNEDMTAALLWVLYLGACTGLAFWSAGIAKRKGYNPTIAGVLTGIFSITSLFIAGFIVLVVYACLRIKYNPCPVCGRPVIFYLTRCPWCNPPTAPASTPQS